MSTGIITTARGRALNIDELIQQAERPIGTKDAKSTRNTGNYRPSPRREPNVRGFVPQQGSTARVTEEAPEEDVPKKTASTKTKSASTSKRTLAEHTKVTVKQTEKKTTDNQKADADKPVDEEDEVLGDIMKDMESKKDESSDKDS